MNLIEKFGLEKCKQIVDGAPEWADTYLEPTGEYCSIEIEVNDGMHLNIKAIRAALADHDRIDTCSDIRNHVSPNTKVIEHE